jgi:predicted PurR-regulated permease PerM
VTPERIVRVRPRTIASVVLLTLAILGVLIAIWRAREVITWVFIALFLALAINPLVDRLERRGLRRGLAAALAFGAVIAVFGGLAAIFIPIVVREVADFADALPGIVGDLTEGRGRLGFLETKYHIVERVREAVQGVNAERLLTASGTALAVAEGVITAIVALITIVVMTFFMLLEGPAWVERGLAQLPPGPRERWRIVGRDIYRAVGGYVSGALIIATIAGVASSIVLSIAGVQYAIALGLLTALFDLVPLAGATIAAVVVSAVAFLDSVPAGIGVLVFFIVYQQFENHVLYPMVYSRTVQLSPLAILIAVLIGASLGGILGALAAIPVAGGLQVLVRDWLANRPRPPLASESEGAL